MLIVAGLLIRSLWQLQRVDPGFDPHGVLTAEIALPATKYPVRADADRFWSALTDRVRSIPGVETAAGTTLLPLRGGGDTYFYVDGRPPATDADKLNATVSVVTDDYFTTMRIPVKSGRTFTGTDRADGPGVMLINEALARRLFPGGNAVGERLVVDFGKPFRGEIVGVVSDVRIYGQANEVPDQMYFRSASPERGSAPRRCGSSPACRETRQPSRPRCARSSASSILTCRWRRWSRWRTSSPARSATSGSAPDSWRDSPERLSLLAVIGLYGVLAYSVTRRSRELGIRIALGARSAEVFRLVVREGMLLVALGVALGLAGSFAATRFVSGMLFDVARTDPNVFVAVTLALLGSGLVACVLPARRATRVDAMEALRSE